MSWQGLNFDFTGVVFDGGDFSGVRFSGGTVNFTGGEFSSGTAARRDSLPGGLPFTDTPASDPEARLSD